MPASHIALAVLIQVLWGPIYTLCKPALNWFPPLMLVAMIYILIALLFTPLMPRPKTRRRTLFLLALFGCTVQTSMVFYALQHLPASTAILAMQLQLPFAVVASWFMGRDKPNLKNTLGSLICLAGVAIVVGRPDATEAYLGIGAMVIGVLSWSTVQAAIPVVAKDHGMTLYTVQAAIPVVAKDHGMTLYAAMARYAAPQMIFLALLIEPNPLQVVETVPLVAWAAVVGITLFGFALPYAIWYWLLVRHRVDELTPFLLLMPVFGVATAAWQLGEPLPASLLLGGGVIVAGLAVIVFRRRKPQADPRLEALE